MIELVLPYPISANRYWRSFVLGKRVMTAPSSDAKKYKRQVLLIAREAGITEPIVGRVHVDIELYPERPQDWIKRARANPMTWDDDVRCIDIDNARKCLYDAMKNVVFDDDRWVWSDTAQRMEPDGRAACVLVRVKEVRTRQVIGDLFEPYDGAKTPFPTKRDDLPDHPF